MSDLKKEYGTEQINSLKPLEAIKKRPGMYIGSTSQKGVTHCVLETTDNCTDEFSAGFGDTVDVTIYEDTSVEVQDHGRGVPVGLHHEWKKVDGTPENTLTGVFTRLHSGSKFGGNSGYAGGTGGLHGVGMKAVNALSTSFIVTVKREGKVYKQEFSGGEPITDVLEIGTCDNNDTGTNIKYHLDNTIFKMTTEPSCKDLQNRLNELASLNAGLKYKYNNKITNVEKEFYHKDGIIGYVARMVEDKKKLYDNIIFIKGEQTCEKGLVNVDIAFSHLDEDEPNETIKTFANSINTFDGGFHLQGFRNVYRKVLNDFAIKNKLTENGIELKYLLDGIKAVISIRIPEPEFENQTKTKLGSIEAQFAVEEIAELELKKLLKDEVYKNIFTTIITRALQVKEAEEAARKARLSKRMSGKLAKHTLPGKLADCENKNGYTEIFMVEGASAGGCFVADTKIKLADGRNETIINLVNEFKQGKKNYVYSLDNDNNITIQPITDAFLTKTVNKYIRLTLDNNKIVECTLDHKFRLKDGPYKEAINLIDEDSLATFDSYNLYHRVIKKEIIEEQAEVYDLTVEPFNNFALSAGVFVHNSAKNGRYSEFQAILALRGKIKNVEKVDFENMLNSDTIKDVIASIGGGIGKNFDIEKVRYDKINIMCDADVDISWFVPLVSNY